MQDSLLTFQIGCVPGICGKSAPPKNRDLQVPGWSKPQHPHAPPLPVIQIPPEHGPCQDHRLVCSIQCPEVRTGKQLQVATPVNPRRTRVTCLLSLCPRLTRCRYSLPMLFWRHSRGKHCEENVYVRPCDTAKHGQE